MMFPQHACLDLPRPEPVSGINFGQWVPPTAENSESYRAIIKKLHREESVMFLDDLLLRRTDWGTLPPPSGVAPADVAALLDPETSTQLQTDDPMPSRH
jgi:hypothetical protein